VVPAAPTSLGRGSVLARPTDRGAWGRPGPGAVGDSLAPGARLSRDLAGEFRHPCLGLPQFRFARPLAQLLVGGHLELRRGLAQQPPRLSPFSAPWPALVRIRYHLATHQSAAGHGLGPESAGGPIPSQRQKSTENPQEARPNSWRIAAAKSAAPCCACRPCWS
jgi:hypothetical protein